MILMAMAFVLILWDAWKYVDLSDVIFPVIICAVLELTAEVAVAVYWGLPS